MRLPRTRMRSRTRAEAHTVAPTRARVRARGLAAGLACSAALGAAPALASSPLDECLAERGIPRVARVRDPQGVPVYALVIADSRGVPTEVATLGSGDLDLLEVFERARVEVDPFAAFAIPEEERATRICSPVRVPRADIDAGRRVVVAAGLNYAAHAEEAGGGDVFVFPKPVPPTAPYGAVPVPADVTLLDYEVELGFVLLEDVGLDALPSYRELMDRTAFFIANEVTDREPILRHAALFGPGDGFVDAKGRPGFLPAGPWMVRGSDLFRAVAGCGRDGLGIRLWVDEGSGFAMRQTSTTARMILDPAELLARLREEVDDHGAMSRMPQRGGSEPRHYPIAVGEDPPRLPAGSVVLTGTPDGVALRVPPVLPLVGRALRNLRGPFEQLRLEELERASTQASGGYLQPGNRVRAQIDGLGIQVVEVGAPGAVVARDACAQPQAGAES
jgi:2-keto-4-pentenoate hydratase/2-oxohepta-3-ene-1,7-dioic acid hydratase in catechol pathway